MPKKRKKTIIIATIISVILMMILAFVLLYINTDMFKSNQTLFTKYVGQNIENIDEIYKQIGDNSQEELLQQKKYTTQMQVKVNYVENIGTSSESTQNSINQLKFKINGQTDPSSQYNYQNIEFLKQDEKVSQIEYIQKEDTYGIKFSDVLEQYLLVENKNLKELFKKLGYTDEEIANLPDKIEWNKKEIKECFQFTEQEKQNIKNRYLKIINNNIQKNNFSRQSNQNIQIGGQNVKANSYTLTITKEQLNHIYLKVLEEMKQDEILLAKIDNIQAILEKYQLRRKEDDPIRKQFETKIEETITQINKNNIGNDETKIIVYENNQTTISTIIQTPEYEIHVDILPNQEQKYLQIAYQEGEKQKTTLTYAKSEQGATITLHNTENGKSKTYCILVDEQQQGDHYTKNTVAKYEDEKNRVEIVSDKQINIVNNLEKIEGINNENAINLNQAEEAQINEVVEKTITGVFGKIGEIMTNVINMEDIGKVLKVTGIIKEEQPLESMGVTQTERNRFNSQFEILQGEDLDYTNALKVIEAIQQNLIAMEVVSNTELKLKLDQYNKNEELVTTLNSFLEQDKMRKYSVKVEYDETTKLVNYVVLTISEKR